MMSSFLLLLAVSPGCVMNQLNERPKNVILRTEREGPPVTFTVVKGPAWKDEVTEGPLKFNLLPQIAMWMETADGQFIGTLYVTGALGDRWTHATKAAKGAEFYRECFPAWSQRVEGANQALPEPQAPYTDAVSSATPHSTFLLSTTIPMDAEDFVVYAEVNRSADYNAHYPAPSEDGFDPLRPSQNRDWNGQPSVVYAVEVKQPKRRQTFTFQPVGWGDPAAPRHINSDLAKLDTALQIVSELEMYVD